jgi:type IV pilus assembly protein PilA
MLTKLRERTQDEKGFTLIELLVVILIIGILAAIALPAFLNQREKAQDSEAKSAVRTAQTALETYYTDKQTYTGATAGKTGTLAAIEPAIAGLDTRLTFLTAGSDNGYKVQVESKGSSKNKFIIKNDKGTVTRTCTTPGTGGCPTGGSW